MVVRFADLGVPDPKGWSRSHGKVYDYNTNAGSFYYQPMLEYIERKQFTGESSSSLAAQKQAAISKVAVELPNALDFSRRNKYEGPSSALDLDNFVVKYTAQQIKQKNTRAIHIKTEMSRGSKSAQTINDLQTSTMIRDRYLNDLAYYNKIGVGKTPDMFEENYFDFKTSKLKIL